MAALMQFRPVFSRLKLRHLSDGNCKRRTHAEAYQEMLGSADGVVLPFEPRWARAVYHLYVMRVRDREQLRAHLAAAGIGTGIHYPIPLHLQKAYRALGYREGDFPVTERVAAEILSLPMYPELSRAEQEYIVENILAHLDLQAGVGTNQEEVRGISRSMRRERPARAAAPRTASARADTRATPTPFEDQNPKVMEICRLRSNQPTCVMLLS